MDPRLPPMQKVFGFSSPDRQICVAAQEIDQLSGGVYRLTGIEVTLSVSSSPVSAAFLRPDGAELSGIGAYWFAWHAAFPEGELVTNLTAQRSDSPSHGLADRPPCGAPRKNPPTPLRE
jgi:hypothetical protein